MEEDLEEDMDPALAEIINPNDFFPDDDDDEEQQVDQILDDRQINLVLVMVAKIELRERMHASYQAWRDTYCEPDLDTRIEVHLKQGAHSMSDDSQLPYLQQLHGPKDGDYHNL